MWLSNAQCNEKSIIPASVIIRLLASGNMNIIVSSVPISSEDGTAA